MSRARSIETEAILGSRRKNGLSVFSGRKPTKITDQNEMASSELQWSKDYAAVLKATGWSYRYISDTLNIQTGIVKSWFSEEEMQAKVITVQQDIVEAGVKHLQQSSVDLVEMLLELARSAVDEAVKYKAIIAGLDRVGISAVSRSESVVTKNEKTEVALSQEMLEHMEGMPMETQEQLAKLAAEMDNLVEASKGAE